MKKTKPAKAAKPSKSQPAKPSPKAAAAKSSVKPPVKSAKPAAKAKPVAKVSAVKAKASAVKGSPAKVKKAAPAKPVGKALKASAPVKAPVAKVSSPKGSKVPVAPVKTTAKDPVVKDVAPAKAVAVKEAKKVKKEAAPKAEVKVEMRPIVAEEPDTAEDVVLTDADGRRYCRTKDCDRLAEVDNYCRYHYILLWKNIQIRRNILQEGKLGRYIEELTARYPDKFLEILKKDLRSEKDFLAAIQELEIDESAVEAEFDDEESQADLFEIQRVSDSGNAGDRSDSDDRF